MFNVINRTDTSCQVVSRRCIRGESEESTRDLKPTADVTVSPKLGYQSLPQKGLMSSKEFNFYRPRT